jgi:hypothetical protein
MRARRRAAQPHEHDDKYHDLRWIQGIGRVAKGSGVITVRS